MLHTTNTGSTPDTTNTPSTPNIPNTGSSKQPSGPLRPVEPKRTQRCAQFYARPACKTPKTPSCRTATPHPAPQATRHSCLIFAAISHLCRTLPSISFHFVNNFALAALIMAACGFSTPYPYQLPRPLGTLAARMPVDCQRPVNPPAPLQLEWLCIF